MSKLNGKVAVITGGGGGGIDLVADGGLTQV
jgi:hypothetical protein